MREMKGSGNSSLKPISISRVESLKLFKVYLTERKSFSKFMKVDWLIASNYGSG